VFSTSTYLCSTHVFFFSDLLGMALVSSIALFNHMSCCYFCAPRHVLPRLRRYVPPSYATTAHASMRLNKNDIDYAGDYQKAKVSLKHAL
jgi:hypothetical protein